MIQTVVLLFAPARELPVIVSVIPRSGQYRMATRPQAPSRRNRWSQQARSVLAIAASSLGFMLFLAGLGLVLRLAEVLLS